MQYAASSGTLNGGDETTGVGDSSFLLSYCSSF